MIANLLGSSVGLSVAYHLERYYRYRREINRLYRPLETSLSDLSDLEDETGTQLLPTYNTNSDRAPKSSQYKAPRFADVWDEREEVFDIGGASDEEDDRIPGPAIPPHNTEQGLIPKITVCGP
ncbi:hypothetical protein C0989_001504 [Termitomyces sp. Mn162]|nr:hypothetical protein C0989_001504 [Termitomyces sp. Mn162]